MAIDSARTAGGVKSTISRAALAEQDPRAPPVHPSCLNQAEIYSSIPQRKVLQRNSYRGGQRQLHMQNRCSPPRLKPTARFSLRPNLVGPARAARTIAFLSSRVGTRERNGDASIAPIAGSTRVHCH